LKVPPEGGFQELSKCSRELSTGGAWLTVIFGYMPSRPSGWIPMQPDTPLGADQVNVLFFSRFECCV
jgi:hypothetical protein